MAKKTEPLSGVDAAWLGMEDPTNLMMVSGIMAFDKPLEYDRLRQVLERRWLKFDRFRQRVVQPQTPWATKAWFPPYWELDENLNLDAHLHRVRLPAPGDREALRELVSRLMSTPLDFSRPLWDMHLIEGVYGGSVLMTRLHHCIADGMALVHVLLSMTDASPDAPQPEAEEAEEEDADDVGLRGGLFEALFKQVAGMAGTVSRLSGKVLKEGFEALGNPAHLLELANYGAENAFAVQRLFLRPDDPKTIFRGKLGTAKRAAWSRPIPLDEVKAIKNFTGGTVNDVLVTAMTGGLRRYLVERDALTDKLNFRAAIPVDLRCAEERGEMGNKFGLVFLGLPVWIEHPLERLGVVRERMDELKSSQEAPVIFGLMSAAGMLAHEIQRILVTMLGAKSTAVMTNLAGPQTPLYLAGRKIDHIMFWVPQSGRIGLGVSILSYNGKVYLGVATDAGLVPDPEKIIDGFYADYQALLQIARGGGQTQPTAQPEKASQPAQEPVARPPVAKKTAARKPIARKPVARKTAPSSEPAEPPSSAPAEKIAPLPEFAPGKQTKAVVRKSIARKPVAKKPAVSRPARPGSGAPENASPLPEFAPEPETRPESRKPVVAKSAAPGRAQPPAVSSTPSRCRAKTKAGRRCRNRPVDGDVLCAIHRQRSTQ